ncbi:MAG TPA: MaoC family dehydratase [Burkholderiaceae bacterium]|nr:MaoC family dehydratase [Burkholderiaceae bacterium]
MPQPKWYFEDFEPGRSIDVGSRTISEQEIMDFARQFDPQPFHVDRQAAAQSIYGGVIASGWHTCSLMMRMMFDGFLRDSSSLGSPGVDEIRWVKPVRAGDTLSVTTTTLEARRSGSKPDLGIVVSVWEGRNQHGELVVTVRGKGMFRRRPPAGEQPDA